MGFLKVLVVTLVVVTIPGQKISPRIHLRMHLRNKLYWCGLASSPCMVAI